ncbi:MerR family transcriptional regulator [Nocardia sp. NPDC051052]|uniref:MerR family transcriptional regulator n=1 Tax=Nocardia sp. NPDC051052 TaxID=3364322 RepID=UPI0037B49F6B
MTAGEQGAPRVEYRIGLVARRFGIPVATLRSWNQRYGLGPPRHRPGTHRHYTPDDVAIIARMVELVRAGASPESAAHAARAVDAPVPALGDIEPVISAAVRLDSTELLATISAHLAHHGVIATWNRLCRPAFAAVVGRQHAAGGDVDVEHALSWAVVAGLHRVSPPLRDTERLRRVVLACTDGEYHTIPLEVLRAALAERGVPAVFLGQSVPDDALISALSKHDGTPVLALWSQVHATARPESVRVARAASAQVLLVGPGWAGATGLMGVQQAESLEQAIEELCRAAAVPGVDT